MEGNRQKWVNLSFVTVSGLLAYVVFTIAFFVVGRYDLEARIPNIDLYVRVGSVAIGALAMLIFYKHERANQYMNEVVAELSRVTWPGGNETVRTTIVVVIMVLISGMILGGLDAFWTWALKWII